MRVPTAAPQCRLMGYGLCPTDIITAQTLRQSASTHPHRLGRGLAQSYPEGGFGESQKIRGYFACLKHCYWMAVEPTKDCRQQLTRIVGNKQRLLVSTCCEKEQNLAGKGVVMQR